MMPCRFVLHRAPLRAGLVFAASLLLAACGGTDGDAPEQTKPEIPMISGTAYLGEEGFTLSEEVRLTGTDGLARTVPFDGPFAYSSKLEDLSGPYAAGSIVTDDALGTSSYLVGLATQPGTANVTPLSTLVVAEGLGVDPSIFFSGLATTGDDALLEATDAQIALGEDRTRRYLTQNLGIAVPDAVASFTGTPFSPVAGDPMFDTITAFNTALAARGTDIAALSKSLAVEGALCNAEDLAIARGDALIDFCPNFKTALPEDADPDIVDDRFTTTSGETLVVATREAAVVSVTYVDAAGRRYLCSDAACEGTSLGDAASDGSRPIVFDGVMLSGADGTATLDGSLQSAPKGASLPPLPCDTNRYYLIHPDNTVQATCAQSDDIGFGAGQTQNAGEIRRIYTFQSDGSVDPPPPSLEIRADDQRVVGVAVWQYGATGPVVFDKCIDTGCIGVTVGPPTDDTTSFAPYVIRTRPIVLADTVVPAVDAAGAASTTDFVTIRASFTSVEIILPPPPLAPLPCGSTGQQLSALVSLQDEPVPVCPPSVEDAAQYGFTPSNFLATSDDGNGGITYSISSLYVGGGSAQPFNGVTIRSIQGAVAEVTFALDAATFHCLGAECEGVTIGEPNAEGEVAISLQGTVLAEIELGGLAGERTATVDGSFVAPPVLQ